MKSLLILLVTLAAMANPAHADDQIEVGMNPNQIYLKSRMVTGNLYLETPSTVDLNISCGSGDIFDNQRSILQIGNRNYKVMMSSEDCNQALSNAVQEIKSGAANTLVIHLALNANGDRVATIFADKK